MEKWVSSLPALNFFVDHIFVELQSCSWCKSRLSDYCSLSYSLAH